jgi:hypothetical protein
VPGSIEVEPLDPAQAATYADKRNLYWPRGAEELAAAHCTRAVMVRNATAKLVYRAAPGVTELYDLAADVGEQKDLAASEPGRVAELQKLYDGWNAEQAEPTVRDSKPKKRERKQKQREKEEKLRKKEQRENAARAAADAAS